VLKVETIESYRITARPPALVPPVCPGCGTISPRLYRFGTLHPEFADVPHHGRLTVLVVERQRWRCRECGKTFLHPLDELDERRMATKRLIEYVQRRSSEDTFTRIARDTGLHEKTVRNIVKEYHREAEEQRRFLPPRILGLDEIYLLRRPRAVVTNLEANTLIDLLANRYRTTVEHRLREITPPGSVEVACIDMWKDYRQAIHNVHPDAAVVADKFHVQRYANVAVENVRKALRANLTKAQRIALKRERGVLLKCRGQPGRA
jgi:transposase